MGKQDDEVCGTTLTTKIIGMSTGTHKIIHRQDIVEQNNLLVMYKMTEEGGALILNDACKIM